MLIIILIIIIQLPSMDPMTRNSGWTLAWRPDIITIIIIRIFTREFTFPHVMPSSTCALIKINGKSKTVKS